MFFNFLTSISWFATSFFAVPQVAWPGGGFLSFWTRFRTDFRRFVIAETLVFTVFFCFACLTASFKTSKNLVNYAVLCYGVNENIVNTSVFWRWLKKHCKLQCFWPPDPQNHGICSGFCFSPRKNTVNNSNFAVFCFSLFFELRWSAIHGYQILRVFFPTISTFGCFWSQWPTSLAVTSGREGVRTTSFKPWRPHRGSCRGATAIEENNGSRREQWLNSSAPLSAPPLNHAPAVWDQRCGAGGCRREATWIHIKYILNTHYYTLLYSTILGFILVEACFKWIMDWSHVATGNSWNKGPQKRIDPLLGQIPLCGWCLDNFRYHRRPRGRSKGPIIVGMGDSGCLLAAVVPLFKWLFIMSQLWLLNHI